MVILCSPWPEWDISGSSITELPPKTGSKQSTSGDNIDKSVISNRILLFVPPQLRELFLSSHGQRLVSHFELYFLDSDSDAERLKVGETMTAKRSTHVHTLRGCAGIIFGFSSDLFVTDFDHSEVPEFQALLGVRETPKGKHYPVLPPILYPDGKCRDPEQLFLNPALIKVLNGKFDSQTCHIIRLPLIVGR